MLPSVTWHVSTRGLSLTALHELCIEAQLLARRSKVPSAHVHVGLAAIVAIDGAAGKLRGSSARPHDERFEAERRL